MKLGPLNHNLIQRLQQKKDGIVVMSLFDGISTGLLIHIQNCSENCDKNKISGYVALKFLGIKVRKYYSSEIYPMALAVSQSNKDEAVEYIGDPKKLTKERIKSYGPIDLLLGGPLCKDLSRVNPFRKKFGNLNIQSTI